MGSRWVRLPKVWKTTEAYQAMNLLRTLNIRAKTTPDEFNGSYGNKRMVFMDGEIFWPIYVRKKQLDRAIAILTEEKLL